ncbi:cytochrome P450-like protein [Leptotrombidium deliense]|uniref:Cytochrome P450-like protein n=1 Tax=Leptotrombidium deliense TaxID=299467 RepID=A0A443RXC9_9ACAR|nr:cytochrome P450-like protein [Leptotrombidium deliense]
MYPPLSMVDRVVQNNCVLGDTGIELEKRTVVDLPLLTIHLFLPVNKINIQLYTFMPFGVEPRQCVGTNDVRC